jgi:hypothetical protein
MNNEIIYQVIGGLLILFYFYLIYMFTKTWRWLQVTTMFFVFAASICLLAYAALSNRTHMAWNEDVAKKRAEIARLEADRDQLLKGDLTELVNPQPSIRDLDAELGRVLLDRGRVWRNCSPTSLAGGTATVTTVDPAALPEGTVPPPSQIKQQTVLYAFIELVAPAEFGLPEGAKVPAFYIGEFIAEAVTATSVTLKPTIPLSASVVAKLNRSGVTWALYETMPVDGHQHFVADPKGSPDWNKNADEEPVFGEMNAERITQVFQLHQGDLGSPALQEIVAKYLRDGKRAAEDDPLVNTWLKVRFLQDHSFVVDSEATLDAVTSGESFFDGGLANVAMVLRGGEAEFKKDDMGIFLKESEFLQPLLDGGVVELIEPIYARRLNDYGASFRALSQRMHRLASDIGQTQRDDQAIVESTARTQQQTAARAEELSKLKEDYEKIQYELGQIVAYRGQLEGLWKDKRAELSRLYRENHQLYNRLLEIQRRMMQQIDAAVVPVSF